LHGAPFALGDALDFLGNVVQFIGLDDAAGTQRFGVPYGPLGEVPII
jgi:hypothetical protein